MNLVQVSKRIWYYPFEDRRDRPVLGYIMGDNWSLAVDAGHSAAHTEEFYEALQAAGLPLPALTVLTHWHWDHTFGMHAVHGLCISNKRTNEHLKEFKDKVENQGVDVFLRLAESIREEYAGGQPVVITLPDLTFEGEMALDAGNCPIRLLQTKSPHTDDSTLIVAEEEKVLFMGDAAGGEFPTWEKDPVLCRELANTVATLDVERCYRSHHVLQTKQELIDDLLSNFA